MKVKKRRNVIRQPTGGLKRSDNGSQFSSSQLDRLADEFERQIPVQPPDERSRPIEDLIDIAAPTQPARKTLYPLDAPGMPLPGPDITNLAAAMLDEQQQAVGIEVDGMEEKLEEVHAKITEPYRGMLYSGGDFHAPITIKGARRTRLSVVTGHHWGDASHMGPRPARVMVIGKMLGEEEKTQREQFVGPSGELIRDVLDGLGVSESVYYQWYMTNLLKTEHPLAESGGGTLRASWIKEWLPLLHQELRIVQPSYILCLGADVTKALLGKSATVKSMEGRVLEFTYPVAKVASKSGKVKSHTALLMACIHPAAVLRAMDDYDKFENSMARFVQLTNGNRWDKEEKGLDHRVIDTLDELKDLYHEIEATCEDNLIALDAEWHGEHPENAGSYMRTIQLSWKDKTAVCISLRHPGGEWRFDGDQESVIEWVTKICRGRRLAGHFLVSDLEWLLDFGIDLRDEFGVADDWVSCMKQALRKGKPKGGFDTGLAAHAVDETADFSLTAQTLRHTGAPRYDVALSKWRDSYCSERKLKKEDLEGFGECPDEVLEPYACYDADVTRRLVLKYQELLTNDRFGNNCWEAFWMSMRAAPAVLEINTTGLLIDRDRMDSLTDKYMKAKDRLEQQIRDWARWPEMNINSVFHVREFLFGERLNGHDFEPGEPPRRLRPKPGRSLYLEPITSTDKRPMRWEEVIRRGLLGQKTASTDKMALAILAQENQSVLRSVRRRGRSGRGRMIEKSLDFSKQVTWIRDYRFISQVLKSTLRVPKIDKETESFIKGPDGFYVYPGGLPAAICGDGHVRTHIYQTKETGRWASARPPLQNLSNRRESDYKRILGDDYLYPIRTILCAPDGCVLIAADYTGAELYGMAVMSGDETMIDHATRNLLDDNDPNFYDIHSNIAVRAFGYDCEPTKAGLKSIGKSHMRVVAKSVIFGIAYGRGAKAIALAAKEEKVDISVDEAQQVINAVFALYPGLVPFFAQCQSRALGERWLCGCFGRFRRFPVARDFMTQGDFERQAQNFPIQGMIADAVSRAVDHLYHYREDHPYVDYRIAMQQHDEIILQVPYEHVPCVMDEVLPECMVNRVPIYPTSLDGVPNGSGPYYLGADKAPYIWWDEDMMPNDCLSRGIDPIYAKWEEKEYGYVHPHYVDKQNKPLVWIGNEAGGELKKLAEVVS